MAFTCSACLVAFSSFDAQRLHYQSEWHRHNLNRRVKEYPPLTEAAYQDFIRRTNPIAEEHFPHKCSHCQKTFPSESALGNHSRQHEVELVKTGEEFEAMLKARLDRNRIDVEHECIFCSEASFESVGESLGHMQSVHGLYLPDMEYVLDVKGVLQYLADKVAVGYCLYCASESALPFSSLEAGRQHMVDKGHLKIRFDAEGSAELADFYEWDDIEGDDDEGTAFITPDGTELVVSTGGRLGNRAYFKYYKQHLRPIDEESVQRRAELSRSQALVRARGASGQLALSSRPISVEEKRNQRIDLSKKLEQELAVGVKANKLQPHFRLQIR